MSTMNGDAWPFYIVLAKDDKRLCKHPTRMLAEVEAKRLVRQTGKPMSVLRVVARYDPAPILVVERSVGPEQFDDGFFNPAPSNAAPIDVLTFNPLKTEEVK